MRDLIDLSNGKESNRDLLLSRNREIKKYIMNNTVIDGQST